MLLSLIQNASMLLLVVVIYALATGRRGGYLLSSKQSDLGVQVQTGLMAGLIAIGMILTPVRYGGLLLDARSVLLSLTALFFGAVPVALTLAMAAAYRLYVGGPAALLAILIMTISAAIGLLWRRARQAHLWTFSLRELYLFGFTVHLAIVALTFAAPRQLLLSALYGIAVPLLVVFPLVELVIGALLVRFHRQELLAQDIKASEERYRLLADNITDIIVQHDLDGRLSYVSPSVRQLGYRPEDLVGHIRMDLTHPDDMDLAHQRIWEVIRGAAGRGFESRIRKADGDWVWIESNPTAILDPDGQVVGILAIWRDQAARKEAEATLHEVRAELARVARISALGAFSASIAHEINQPLSALVANTETARRYLTNDPPNLPMVESALARCTRDAWRASEIVGRLRSLAAKGPLKSIDFDLHEAIGEVLELTQRERQRSKVTAELDLIRDPIVVRGDRIQVQQVLVNLTQNAVEAMRARPEGERRLVIRTRPAEEDGKVRVEVEDRGHGLDPQTADQIFAHLFTTKEGGTGLGLAIAQSIIEAHGGRIWAEPADPKGTVFRFELPQTPGA